MKAVLTALRLLLAAVFIFSAISKLIPIEVFELNLVYEGVANWELAPYLARGIICIELFLGTALLFNSLLKQIILPAALSLIVLFTLYLFFSIYHDGNSGNCGCFGNILPMTPLESIFKNVILLFIIVFLYLKSPLLPWNIKWLVPVLFVFSSSLIVLLFPIYIDTASSTQQSTKISPLVELKGFEGASALDLKKGKKLLAVFNMACHHCIAAALQISAIRSRITMPPSYFLLLGDSSEIKEFYQTTHSVAPYKLMNAEQFIKQYKSGWPSVLLLENGKIIYDNQYKPLKGEEFEQRVKLFLKEPS